MKPERQLTKALGWIKRHRDSSMPLSAWIHRAAWRFNVDGANLTERVRQEAKGRLCRTPRS